MPVALLLLVDDVVASGVQPPTPSTWDGVARWVVVGLVALFLAMVRSMMAARDRQDARQQTRLDAIETALTELTKSDTSRIVQTVQVVGDVTHGIQGLREDVQRMGSEVRRAAEDRTIQRAILEGLSSRIAELVEDLKEIPR